MSKFNTVYIERTLIVDCNNKKSYSLSDFAEKNSKTIERFNLNKTKKQVVALIGGGMAAEREVSMMSADGVSNSLLELGYQVIFMNMGADIGYVLNTIKPDIVYNSLHGTHGEDGCLPGLLNIMNIPYTGPGVMSSALALNKKKSAEIFRANNINIAKSIIVKKSDDVMQDPIPRPYVIKPLSQGSSIGIEVIFAEDSFNFADYQFDYGDEVLVEEYIKGREVQVAVLNGKAIGALEVKISEGKRFYDYEVKYTEGLAQHIMPAPIPQHIYNESLKIAEDASNIFECTHGIARAEFLYSEEKDQLYMLELNTHPGMTPLSICPEILEHQGISYTSLVEQIIKNAKFEK